MPDSPFPIAGLADTHRINRTINLRTAVFMCTSETEKLRSFPYGVVNASMAPMYASRAYAIRSL